MKKTFLESAHGIAKKMQHNPDKALQTISDKITDYINLALPPRGNDKGEACLIHDEDDVVCILKRESDTITQCTIFDQPRGISMGLLKVADDMLHIDYRTDATKEKIGDIRDLFKPIIL